MANKKTKITITRALAELKLLDKRILKSIQSGVFTSIKVNGITHDDNFTPKEDYQSINDLINRRAKIKSAIMVSNASTKLNIAGKSYTVIEAIELKSSIEYRQILLRKLQNSLVETTSKVEEINENVQYQLDKHLQAMFGKDTKVQNTDYDNIATPFLKTREAEIVNPLDLQQKITDLSDEIDKFESDVDIELSISNSTTTITV